MQKLVALAAVLAVVLATVDAGKFPRERRQAEAYTSCNQGTGKCVPYYLCRNNTIVTDGSGLIDVRIGAAADPTNPRATPECKGFLEVCCGGSDRVTTTTTTQAPYTSRCGRRNNKGIDVRIQGFEGNQAQFGEFPWMAAVLKKEQTLDKEINLYQCGGVLIDPYIVLTVAHCVHQSQPNEMRVRLGEWDTQNELEPYRHQDIDVVNIVIHQQFNPGNLQNDFALLFLASPAELSSTVDTICLTPDFGIINENRECVVTGWGKDKFGQEGLFQNVLKAIDLPHVPNPTCQAELQKTRLGQYFQLDDSFLCYGGQAGRDACQGDGGSPLVCRDPATDTYVLGGLVAWGIGCGEANLPGVYANTIYGYDWIYTTAGF